MSTSPPGGLGIGSIFDILSKGHPECLEYGGRRVDWCCCRNGKRYAKQTNWLRAWRVGQEELAQVGRIIETSVNLVLHLRDSIPASKSAKPATLESRCRALYLVPQLLFPSIPNAQLFDPSGPGPWIVPICQAASLRSVQVLERLQRSHINLVIPSSDKAVVSPYIVLAITICFSYIFFLLGSKILRRYSA